MPEIRRYKVAQVREVEVEANSVTDAARIAAAAFEHGQNSDSGVANGKAPEGVWGNTIRRIREVSLEVTNL